MNESCTGIKSVSILESRAEANRLHVDITPGLFDAQSVIFGLLPSMVDGRSEVIPVAAPFTHHHRIILPAEYSVHHQFDTTFHSHFHLIIKVKKNTFMLRINRTQRHRVTENFNRPQSHRATESQRNFIEHRDIESQRILIEHRDTESQRILIEHRDTESQRILIKHRDAESQRILIEHRDTESQRILIEHRVTETQRNLMIIRVQFMIIRVKEKNLCAPCLCVPKTFPNRNSRNYRNYSFDACTALNSL